VTRTRWTGSAGWPITVTTRNKRAEGRSLLRRLGFPLQGGLTSGKEALIATRSDPRFFFSRCGAYTRCTRLRAAARGSTYGSACAGSASAQMDAPRRTPRHHQVRW